MSSTPTRFRQVQALSNEFLLGGTGTVFLTIWDLSVQLQYLIAGSSHVRLRGTKGKEGEGKVGGTVALTVLFDPIGLIKHEKLWRLQRERR